jgi:hypothetical protein
MCLGWLKNHHKLLLVGLAIFLLWYNLTEILLLATWVRFNPDGVWLGLLHDILRKWAIGLVVAAAILVYVFKIKLPKVVFDWKTWAFPVGSIILYAGWMWANRGGVLWFDSSFSVGNYRWNYLALIQYSFFFLVQLYAWQKRGLTNYLAWTLSFIGSYMVSQYYEMAWFVIWEMWNTWTYQVWQSLLFIGVLAAIRFKPKVVQLLPLLLLCGYWTAIFLQPSFQFWSNPFIFWVHRAAPMPFFLSIPLVWKETVKW